MLVTDLLVSHIWENDYLIAYDYVSYFLLQLHIMLLVTIEDDASSKEA